MLRLPDLDLLKDINDDLKNMIDGKELTKRVSYDYVRCLKLPRPGQMVGIVEDRDPHDFIAKTTPGLCVSIITNKRGRRLIGVLIDGTVEHFREANERMPGLQLVIL